MQGTTAQIIAIITHGNAFLIGSPKTDLPGFFPANNTFMFCEYVRFADLREKGEGWEEISYASDPASWFERLKKDGVYGLRMGYGPTQGQKVGVKTVPDRMLAGFVGGGGRWVIETLKPGGSDYWEARWEVGDRKRTNQKIWQVTYGRIASDQPTAGLSSSDMSALKSRLADNLQAIGDFARRQDMHVFAEVFAAGLAALNSAEADKCSYELAPDSMLPLAAVQLLDAAQTAWVFGGMGSWNDVWFEGEAQTVYEHLSEELYHLLNAAIVTATNTSCAAVR